MKAVERCSAPTSKNTASEAQLVSVGLAVGGWRCLQKDGERIRRTSLRTKLENALPGRKRIQERSVLRARRRNATHYKPGVVPIRFPCVPITPKPIFP